MALHCALKKLVFNVKDKQTIPTRLDIVYTENPSMNHGEKQMARHKWNNLRYPLLGIYMRQHVI